MMSNEMNLKLRQSIVGHETYAKFPYVDTVGKVTIGIGYNLTDRGIDDDWINKQYREDVNYFYSKLSENFSWFEKLCEDRKIALIDMCFNLGFQNFCEFKKMILFLALSNYKDAAKEMLKSKWATQVGNRATRLASIIETGTM